MKRMIWALALLGACSDPDTGPARIAYGEDACDACRMIISEAPFAAQGRGERVEKFDDIGCLARRASRYRQLWVTDHATGRWLDAKSALYVHAPDLYTPMASGLVAFEGREAAEAFAAKHSGKVVAFDYITQLFVK